MKKSKRIRDFPYNGRTTLVFPDVADLGAILVLLTHVDLHSLFKDILNRDPSLRVMIDEVLEDLEGIFQSNLPTTDQKGMEFVREIRATIHMARERTGDVLDGPPPEVLK